MNFRIAVMADLTKLKAVYRKIIQNMNDNSVDIWDEIYPCDYFAEDIGSLMLNKAADIAKVSGAEYLRLFVVDINKPAISLYIKNGFSKAEGVYDEVIDDELTLHEYGFEIKTAD